MILVRAQLSQEHDGMEFPIAFLSHTFLEMQKKKKKWSTKEQEAWGALLHIHQIELLSARSRYYSTE